MNQRNGRLIAGVAAVAVAAVVAGGFVASRQSPEGSTADAAPLPGSSSTPPSSKPTSGTSTATNTGPATVDVAVKKLAEGRAPQLPYLVDREVRGGAGGPVKIPGTGTILGIARLNTSALAVVERVSADKDKLPFGSDLIKVRYGEVTKTSGVSTVVGRDDQAAVAYATTRYDAKGDRIKGSDMYATTDESAQRLELTNSWDVEVLAYRNASVYFRAAATSGGPKTLYQWKPGAPKATSLKGGESPVAIANDGTIAASLKVLNDGSCATVTEIATGGQLWRTCDSKLAGFTPDSQVAVGLEAAFESCSTTMTALEARTGKLIRTWKGCFHDAVAEDDQHLLAIAVVSGSPVQGGYTLAIIRCSIPTGQCERSTANAVDQVVALR
ncbi:hypothetical protein OHA70_15150 [Kribbella sp. NBC_00382]|uniref:hypothetical protein n=1 Tax=Kribbella sp. NBC_00382 TaxID=2975967 RepID=UPI002E1F1E34